MEFDVGDLVEAIDLVGVWSRGKIMSIENGEITVHFDGYNSRHNRLIHEHMVKENIRAPTEPEYCLEGKRRRIDEDIKKANAHIRGLERDDHMWFYLENEVCEGVVEIVDPMRMIVFVKLANGEQHEVSAYYVCDSPAKPEPVKQPRRNHKQKLFVTKEVEEEKVAGNHREPEDPPAPYFPLVFCLRPSDGLRFQVGDITKARNFLAPLIISEMWQEGTKVYAKLLQFNVATNLIASDFFIQCDINFLSAWDGEKVKAKSSTEALFNAASEQLLCFLKNNDSSWFRLFYRKLSLGRVLRDGISSGFSNLSSSRFSLGPFDFFTDVEIFNFDGSFVKKFSLLKDGDFCFLDAWMGAKWDTKMGKDLDSFFKYVTAVEVSRTRDFVLMCNIRFSESNFLFCDNYRLVCKNNILERKSEMAAIQ